MTLNGNGIDDEEVVSVARLSRDLRDAATSMTTDEARFLVDAYYSMQHNRIQANNQVLALGSSAEPHAVLTWLATQSTTLEGQVKAALDKYSASKDIGKWARSQLGIGPVIAAGLIAHIDCTVPTAGSVWRFAGLDPTALWEKGKKRPHNAALKILCWKMGESFVKVSGKPNGFYGKVYASRKKLEIHRNEAGLFQSQAIVGAARVKKTTDAYKWYSGQMGPATCWRLMAFRVGTRKKTHYHVVTVDIKPSKRQAKIEAHVLNKTGSYNSKDWIIEEEVTARRSGVEMLPPAHIHSRAKRYAVKLFLAHYHEIGYKLMTGKPAPLPYPIQNDPKHTFVIPPGGSPEALAHIQEVAQQA